MSQIKTGIVLNYVLILLNMLLGILYTPYMLRMLGQNEFGLYSLVASIIAYLTIMDFGFGNAIIRYTARFKALDNKTKMWELFGMFIIIYSIIGLLAGAIGTLLYFNIDFLFDRTLSDSDLVQAKIMMALLILNLVITFPLSTFRYIITAYEDFVFLKVIQIIRIFLTTGVMIVLLSKGYKAVSMVVVQTAVNLSILILNWLYCKYRLRIHLIYKTFDFALLKEVSLYSFWIFLNISMDKIYWSTGQFVLGAVSGTIAVAIFSVAVTLQQMYLTFSTAISGVLLPKITKMVATDKSNIEISNIFISTSRLQAYILWLILSGFIVFGKSFMNLWAGKGYTESYFITIIFFITLFIPLIQNIGISILQARNQMKFSSITYTLAAVVSLLFQIILSKKYGAIGCAVAIGGMLLIGQGLIMNVYYARCQKINMIQFWKELGIISITPIILTIIGLFTTRFIDYNHIPNLIIGIISFILTYSTFMWSFTLKTSEKNIIVKPINKLFGNLGKSEL